MCVKTLNDIHSKTDGVLMSKDFVHLFKVNRN